VQETRRLREKIPKNGDAGFCIFHTTEKSGRSMPLQVFFNLTGRAEANGLPEPCRLWQATNGRIGNFSPAYCDVGDCSDQAPLERREYGRSGDSTEWLFSLKRFRPAAFTLHWHSSFCGYIDGFDSN
jgi:hypothetical protein